MKKMIKAQNGLIKATGGGFRRLTYEDGTFEDFEIIRGAIAWPRESIPGLIIIGAIPRGTETIKVLEETPFKTLPEARNILADHKGQYSRTLYCIYYQNIPESEGFIKYLKGDKVHPDPPFKVAPFSESIDYVIQLVSSCIDDKKLKVPGDGILAEQLQAGWKNISSEKNLHGVIALACLISGMRARFDSFFPEDSLNDLPPEWMELVI